MVDYTEEIFDRAERNFSSVSTQLAWLKGFDKPGKNKYEADGVIVYEDLKIQVDLIEKAKKTDNYEELETIKSQGNKIKVSNVKEEFDRNVKEKEQKLDEEEISQQEEFIAEAESLKFTFKNPSNDEEKQDALERLQQLDKRIAASVKGWETRRKNQALKIAKI